MEKDNVVDGLFFESSNDVNNQKIRNIILNGIVIAMYL